MSDHDDKASSEHIDVATRHHEGLMPEPDALTSTEPPGWKTWAVVFTGAMQYWGFGLVLTYTGFWSATIAASYGNDASLAFWMHSAWIPITACLAAPLARWGDVFGRRWIWIGANLIGALGNLVIATAPNDGAVIAGVCLWGVCFSNAGNVLAAPAEVIPRRHRGTSNQILQIGGFFGTTTALLCGARWTTDSPSAVNGVYPGWRFLAWYGMGVYLIIAGLLFIFYRPPKTVNHGNRSFMTRLLDFDKVGTLLWVIGVFGTILPLVWGGVSYGWTHVAVVLPLVVGLFTLLIILPVHQYRKKEGAFFNHVLFRNRNMALALVGIFTEGGAYIVFNTYFGAQVLNLGWATTPFPRAGYNLTFVGGMWFAAIIYTVLAYKYRCIKELTIFGYAVFLVVCAIFAGAQPSWGKPAYALAFFAGVGISGPLSFLFAIAQLSIDPAHQGLAMGLMIALRQSGNVFIPVIGNAVQTSKFTADFPKRVGEAALAAGLPQGSLAAFLPAVMSKNVTRIAAVPGSSIELANLGIDAMRKSYSFSYHYTWAVAIPFAFASLVAAFFFHNTRREQNNVVDRPMEHHAPTTERMSETKTDRVA